MTKNNKINNVFEITSAHCKNVFVFNKDLERKYSLHVNNPLILSQPPPVVLHSYTRVGLLLNNPPVYRSRSIGL